MALSAYIRSVRRALDKLNDYGYTESFDLHEEIRAGKQAVIEARITLVNGSTLYVKEFVDVRYRAEVLSYAYQYQDAKGSLIFRYDNANHRPDLGYNFHKHLQDGSVIRFEPATLAFVVDEVLSYL